MKIPFLEAIENGGVVADGAMGTLLYERGVFINRNFDEVCLSQPELVYKIHREYLLAGAQLLESNTYGANRIRLAKHGLADKIVEINRAAVDIVRRAAEDAAYLAGSIGPTGLSTGELRRAEADVRAAYGEQAKLLSDAGCQVLIIETFANPWELRLAIEEARAATSLPIVAQVAVNNKGEVSDGTDPASLALEMQQWGADVVGANCNGPEVIYDVVAKMVETRVPICAMPNAGRPQNIEDRHLYLATPENFGVYARRMFKAGVKMVGGCCGTSPAHINRVSAASRMVVPRQLIHTVEIQDRAEELLESPVASRSKLGSLLGKRFVVSVEVNPGPGLDVESPIARAKTLLQSGADIINIADGPRATARMGNLALAVKMQQALGCEALLHICCRDRNFLGLQAFVLGAHVFGLRNLVIITGDPPKVGDYPDATAVYDVDSIGLIKMVRDYNRGIDPSGKALNGQTQFVIATGVEPGAVDFEREMIRLHRKVEAGANLIMTQPIYDPQHLERFLEASKDIPVPVLVGILPLASYRNAEFIHNEIPGMGIPEGIRERMRRTGKGMDARKEGVRIAVESLLGVRDRVAGAYIMPPLGRFEMAEEIIAALGSDRSVRPGVPGYAA